MYQIRLTPNKGHLLLIKLLFLSAYGLRPFCASAYFSHFIFKPVVIESFCQFSIGLSSWLNVFLQIRDPCRVFTIVVEESSVGVGRFEADYTRTVETWNVERAERAQHQFSFERDSVRTCSSFLLFFTRERLTFFFFSYQQVSLFFLR